MGSGGGSSRLRLTEVVDTGVVWGDSLDYAAFPAGVLLAFSRLGAPAFVCSDARLAQLVERRLYTANVGGSIPSARTNIIKCLRLWIGP
jgi:hypothetical protein